MSIASRVSIKCGNAAANAVIYLVVYLQIYGFLGLNANDELIASCIRVSALFRTIHIARDRPEERGEGQ